MPQLEGSNAGATSGNRTVSGKPMLAGDPQIGFSAPAVWYEAHLKTPDMELYGHFQVLVSLALLGHNRRFGWSMTMLQNDDTDMVIERPNPDNPKQVWNQGRWVDLEQRIETISVKGAAPVTLPLRRSPHGPIITDAYPDNDGGTPVAMWWAFLETENPILDAFYELNRADTLDRARQASSKIHAPGLNVVWANASGVNVPGYYHPLDRAQRLVDLIQDKTRKSDVAQSMAMQRDVRTGYRKRVLTPILQPSRFIAEMALDVSTTREDPRARNSGHCGRSSQKRPSWRQRPGRQRRAGAAGAQRLRRRFDNSDDDSP